MTAEDSDGMLLLSPIVQCLLRLTCRGALLLGLFLPCVLLPLAVELVVVVVATKNRSGTIVTAKEKQKNKMKTDIKFSARHVSKVRFMRTRQLDNITI